MRRDSAAAAASSVRADPHATVACLVGASIGMLFTLQARRRNQKKCNELGASRHIAEEAKVASATEGTESTDSSISSSPSLEAAAAPPKVHISPLELCDGEPARRAAHVAATASKRIRRRAKRIITDALRLWIERRRAEQARKEAEASAATRHAAKRAKRERRAAAARYIQRCARRMLARRAVARIMRRNRHREAEKVRRREKRSARRWAKRTISTALLAYIRRRRAELLGGEGQAAWPSDSLVKGVGTAFASAAGPVPDRLTAGGMNAAGYDPYSQFCAPCGLANVASPIWDHCAAAGFHHRAYVPQTWTSTQAQMRSRRLGTR